MILLFLQIPESGNGVLTRIVHENVDCKPRGHLSDTLAWLPYSLDWADSGREFDPPAGLLLITQPFDKFCAHHDLTVFLSFCSLFVWNLIKCMYWFYAQGKDARFFPVFRKLYGEAHCLSAQVGCTAKRIVWARSYSRPPTGARRSGRLSWRVQAYGDQIISKAIFVFLTSLKKRTKKWKKLTC